MKFRPKGVILDCEGRYTARVSVMRALLLVHRPNDAVRETVKRDKGQGTCYSTFSPVGPSPCHCRIQGVGLHIHTFVLTHLFS